MKLSEILYDMDFNIEKHEENNEEYYMIYDTQTHEYKDCGDDYKFHSVEEIIERMEVYINDYWFRELEEELSELGELTNNTWETMYNQTLKHKDRFQHPEYLTYLNVIDCLVHPSKLESIC